MLTTAWTAFPEPVTVKADPKATFATNPVDVEEGCFTDIAHLPYPTHCSLPCHFLWWEEKRDIVGIYSPEQQQKTQIH